MASATIAETRDRLSSIVNSIVSGAESEHIIRRRNTPVAKIVPYVERAKEPQLSNDPRSDEIANSHSASSSASWSIATEAASPIGAKGLCARMGSEGLRTRADSEPASAFGMLARYADEGKRAAEKTAWAQAAARKHIVDRG